MVMAAALALAVTLPAAQAQSIRTFVSTSGSDNPSCSLASPCRHFQAAVAATALGGEVDALDPGAYGSFTITQAISIEGQGWSYVAPPANGAAITINAGTGIVNIRGVSLNGIGVSGANGIQFNSGTTLNVQNSVIRNFATDGLDFDLASTSAIQLFVSNTLVSDNLGAGITISPLPDSGTITGVLDRVEIENNQGDGLNVSSQEQTMNITVSDSLVSNNKTTGIYASDTPVSVMVRNSTIANNGGIGLQGAFSGTIRVTRSTITGNATGWNGIVLSYGDNNIDGNGAANTEPPNPLTYK
jgi:hypothetical protein